MARAAVVVLAGVLAGGLALAGCTGQASDDASRASGSPTPSMSTSPVASSPDEPSSETESPTAVTSPPAELRWAVSAQDLGNGLGFVEWSDEFSVDLVLTLPEVWVVGLAQKPERMLSALVGLDPSTGAVLWRQDLDSGLCSQQVVGLSIACLTAVQGTDDQSNLVGALDLVSIDALTGELRRTPSSLSAPIRIYPTDAGLMVVTASQERVPGEGDQAPGARLSMLDWSDAHEVWGAELGQLDRGELLFARTGGGDLMQINPDWEEAAGVVILGSILAEGVLLIDPAVGPITVAACENHLVFEDSLYCQVTNRKTEKTAVLRRDLAGVALWAADDLALPFARVPQGTQPVALRGTRVLDVDWETGAVGAEVLDLGDPADRQFSRGLGIAGLGGADPTFVHNDDETVAAFNGDGSLAWTRMGVGAHPRELVALDDVVVLADHDGEVMGLDRLAGAEIWRLSIPDDGWVEAVPGAVVVISPEAVQVFNVP